ncbi:MAG: ABC transporter permease, partial [Limnohabitans sp.]
MLAYILQRLIQALVVMVTVAFVAFLLFQYVGDPVVFLLGQDATQEEVERMRADLGLDQPFFVQFGHFLYNAVQGEFGMSLRQGAKVSGLIAERFPATLELALVAAGLALLVGIPMGVYAALRRGTFLSQLFMTISLLGVSLPTFLIGILLILVFAVGLGWFPSSSVAGKRSAIRRETLAPWRRLRPNSPCTAFCRKCQNCTKKG